MQIKFFLLFLLFYGFGNTFAQDSSPKIGEYYCYTTTLETSPFGINPIAVQPAFFGNIILDGKGNYKMTRRPTGGNYSFNKATATLTFTTGDLKIMKVKGYKSNEFFIQWETNAFHCVNGKNDTPTKPLTNPNASFTGIIVASLTYQSVDYIDLANSNTTNTFSYSGNTKSSNTGFTIHLEEANQITSSKDYPVVEIRDYKGNILLSYEGKSKNGKLWEIGGYDFGVISPDNSKFLLTGRHFEKIGTADYNYRALRDPAFSVIDLKTGNEIKTFLSDAQNKWSASWLPNGGVMIPHKGGGIDITDANFGNIRTIYNQQVQFAKPNPDGKTIIFQKGTQLFTINIDGSNEKQFTNAEVGLDFATTRISDVSWSPDGNSIAIMMADANFSNKYTAILLSADGTKASMLKDKIGNNLVFIRPYISWITTKQTQANLPATTENPTITDNNSATFTPNRAMAYQVAQTNSDPRFAKAYNFYTKTMSEDFDNLNDVAVAFTYIVTLNYAFYHQQFTIPKNQLQKIYLQFAEKLLQTDSFKNATNEVKQQLAEKVILDGVQTLDVAVTKDEKKTKEISLRMLRQYLGKSADTLKITDNGMEF
jgi:hypothetical protein